LIADLIGESAHLFRAVAPVLGIVKMGLEAMLAFASVGVAFSFELSPDRGWQ
jgi:hypothetical protein